MHDERLRERFWAKVQVGAPDECWEWTASRMSFGYGQIMRKHNGKKAPQRAHRISWEIANGRAVPSGMCVLHNCDNPPCVNPAHLRIGTQADNAQDKLTRRRQSRGAKHGRAIRAAGVRGERHGLSVLTNAQAIEIHRSDEPSARLAKRFGVSYETVRAIKTGKRWGDVTGAASR